MYVGGVQEAAEQAKKSAGVSYSGDQNREEASSGLILFVNGARHTVDENMTTTHENLRLVLVTPETTVLDERVEALRFPLYDGQIGILPGRAPLVGRLGYGELHITEAGVTKSYFVDGGFVQVKGSVVSLLTNRAQPAKTLDSKQAENELQTGGAASVRQDRRRVCQEVR